MKNVNQIKKYFSNNLKKILFECNLSNLAFAKLLEMEPSQVSSYVRGKYLPTIPTILRMAYALGISTDELLGFEAYVAEMEK